jgi:hypothetical protein
MCAAGLMRSDDAILPRLPWGGQSAEWPALLAHGNSIHRITHFTLQKVLQ